MRTSQSYLTSDEVIAVLKAPKERFVTMMVQIACSWPRKEARFTVRSSSAYSRRLPSLLGSQQANDTRTF
jgi:ribosome biogenesis protein Tsr3